MKMFYKNLLIVAFITSFLFVLETEAQTNQSQDIPTLTYGELIQNKEIHFEKTVRVKAIWTYGFEWSFLCDSECKNLKKTWVDFIDEDDLCKGSKGKLKKGSRKFYNKAEVVFIGKLSSGGFGHLGAYEYQFTVRCVEKFKKLKSDLKK